MVIVGNTLCSVLYWWPVYNWFWFILLGRLLLFMKVGSWVRIGPAFPGPRRFGVVQALCQGGMRAVVRIYSQSPLCPGESWRGEELLDVGLLSLICRPEWDRCDG